MMDLGSRFMVPEEGEEEAKEEEEEEEEREEEEEEEGTQKLLSICLSTAIIKEIFFNCIFIFFIMRR